MNKKEESKQKQLLTTAHFDYQNGLNRYSFFKIHERQLSEDLVQDTFIKTWKYLMKGGKIILMKSFLYHVLNGLIIDEYRKKKPISLDTLIENGFEPRNVDNERNNNIFDGKIAIDLIKNLPVKYQNIMRMKYIQDLTLDEMHTLTGLTKNTLAVQIHRGVEKLRALYNHQGLLPII